MDITTSVIQIGPIETAISIVVFLVTVGVSWGKLTSKINNISGALHSLRDKIENIDIDLRVTGQRLTALETKVEFITKYLLKEK